MLTEVDIVRIMASQRLLTESIAQSRFDSEAQNMLDDDELFEMLDTELSISETNGLI